MFDSLYHSRNPRKNATHANCTHCGKQFGKMAYNSKTCSEACRTARAKIGGQINAERARLKRLAAKQNAEVDSPQP